MYPCKPWQSSTRLALAALAALAGCSASPVQRAEVWAAQIEHRPPAPVPVYGDADHALYCLGDRLRELKAQPLLIGYSAVADTTGKTGVDLVALLRSELSKVVARGNNLAITAMGFGPSAKPELPSIEERDLLRDPARAARLVRPDWLITGGTVSVTSAFIGLQKSGGLSARDLDLSGSGTTTVDLVSLSFGVKWAESGIDMPMQTADVRVSYQLLSASNEVGVFAQAKADGRKLAAGLRFGRTVAVAQVAEDAIRAGISGVVIQILASRYGVDMSTCPAQTLTPDALLPKAQRLPAPNELPAIWKAMSVTERISWFQGRLATYGYAPGGIDGKLGPRMREALGRAAQDHHLPPSGQGSEALFYVLATRSLAHGHDPRQPLPALAQVPPRIHVTLQQPNAAYAVGVYLRATVVAPQAGYMNCWLVAPEGAWPLYPILAGRGQFVAANTPVLLPDTNATGPHPRVRVTSPGAHELWCGLARSKLTDRLPADLRPGGQPKDPVSTAALRQAFAKAAGSDWLAEGSAPFEVVAARQ